MPAARIYPPKRMKKLSAPAHQEEIRAYQTACKKLEIEPADTLRKLANALVLHAESHAKIVFPLRFDDGAPGPSSKLAAPRRVPKG